ncbi:MAG TPA: dTDP-4-dehydrorhamnose 3,5-epimerase family protein, partial [Polyangiales bacterium]|nr:dTDP-4-dehydrorhamnose 3,5-epimerase family protein [Polyangiales bacterium]
MIFQATRLPGAQLIELERRGDERGYFARTFCEREFAAHGLPVRFPQCNASFNALAGTLRGMHFNAAPQREAKLVRCTRGAIYDVIVDLREGSPTRFQWLGVELSEDNGSALFIPEGFAHGFLTRADKTEVFYHMSAFYSADVARGVRWDDP